jgi:tetratricopeptide (TPR) repeat protein
MSELAELMSQRGKHAEAERLALGAIAIERQAFGPKHVNVADLETGLVNVYMRAGRWADAERVQRRTLETRERTYGAYHTAYAGALVTWADALIGLERYDEAIAVYQRAIDIRRHLLGKGSTVYGIDVSRLARAYARKGDYSAADSLFRVALASQTRYAPDPHPDVRAIYALMADRYRRQGNRGEAERFQRLAQPR